MSEKELPKKYLKVVQAYPDWQSAADSADVDELKKLIVQAESNIYVIEQEKANDVKLVQIKEDAKLLNSSYAESSKVQISKLKYAVHLLEGKGVQMDHR